MVNARRKDETDEGIKSVGRRSKIGAIWEHGRNTANRKKSQQKCRRRLCPRNQT